MLLPLNLNRCVHVVYYTCVFLILAGGLRGRVVKVADLRSQVPHCCRFDPHSGRNLSCEEFGLRKVGGSTQMTARALNNTRRGTWGLPPPIKLEKSTKNLGGTL
jgi:hypothetical protein